MPPPWEGVGGRAGVERSETGGGELLPGEELSRVCVTEVGDSQCHTACGSPLMTVRPRRRSRSIISKGKGETSVSPFPLELVSRPHVLLCSKGGTSA